MDSLADIHIIQLEPPVPYIKLGNVYLLSISIYENELCELMAMLITTKAVWFYRPLL
jgi:hypothetical protein